MDAIAERLLDAALALAAGHGWDALQLHELALREGLTLADVQRRFDGKDALAEALFDRAERALLAATEQPGWAALSVRERLAASLQAWFAVLAPHHRLVREMLAYKLHPEHLHLQAQGLLRISRTVQWWREAAGLQAQGWRRELAEAGLSAIYLGTVLRWLGDDTPGQSASRDGLARQLRRAERLARWL